MSFSEKFVTTARKILPSPFTIAVLLTIFTFFIALIFTQPNDQNIANYSLKLLGFWEKGIWSTSLMAFSVQMMLMLVLGHALALTQPVNWLIDKALVWCRDTASAAFVVTFLTVLVALFNWGLGLIFGAIFARKVGDKAKAQKIPLNYPLIGAAGYSGLMVWHGGISGSATTKVAENGHLQQLMQGIFTEAQIASLPSQITFSETVFSNMNLVASVLLLLILPMVMYFVGKKSKPSPIYLNSTTQNLTTKNETPPFGAEKLDRAAWLSVGFGMIILFYALCKAIIIPEKFSLGFINPNFINFSLLGLCLVFHRNFTNFLSAINEAIGGAAGILIQFPLYFGIMGLMNSSGLVNVLSNFFVHISSDFTFPFFTFLSAGIVNVFVPSGGGQWAVQGPIIIEAAQQLGVSLPKCVMALAYGDQVTNMLQPFWALPLLGITQLKAQDIIPYTLLLMVVGTLIYLGVLGIF